MSLPDDTLNPVSPGKRIPCPHCGYPIVADAPDCKWCGRAFGVAAAEQAGEAANRPTATPALLNDVLSCRRELCRLSRAELVDERDLLARESRRLRRKGWQLMACGVAAGAFLLAAAAFSDLLEPILLTGLAQIVFGIASLVCFVLAFISLARSRGRSSAFALLIVLGPVGLLVLLAIPNRYPDRLAVLDALLRWRETARTGAIPAELGTGPGNEPLPPGHAI
jgi:hypothetical protein